ncbi:MAG TPA: TIM-barrel domain-containing protein, partial [Terriglobia bacterium]|nr:TIM-barrel domain-containing protein [Terriglobia bacterium]
EQAAPYQLWSFQGSSYAWGKDDVLPISQKFSQPNLMGGPTPQGLGGGVPVIDFWTARVGMAMGHIETSPRVLSLPVRVEKDGRIDCSMVLEPHVTLKPGEAYSTPRSFVAVHSGDFYEALRLWSRVLQNQGWSLPKPTDSDYSVNWCGWGYESDFTPAEMLGTIPKLKDLKITWATLDYRWFNNYGDWEPRADTFPDDSIKKVVDEYHKNGIRIQLWWQPIAVEDGQGKHSLPKPMETSRLSKEHADWLILDKDGKRARMGSPVSAVAAMCPALPEVREYHRQLVEKFIREWDFDGSKLDSIFTVPPCFNPKHKHKSPNESIRAMADVYKVIFETTRSLKPDSVTQICPCGTPPNYAWLPFMDQAVTADPVGSVQVRRRMKMYKALLGAEAAVYGDHVELSGMVPLGDDYIESGEDFASTVGTGGVVGTKFTWPGDAPNPRTRKVRLTAEKEARWKKWIDIYNSKMLSRGTFLNLYTLGYDVPEGYAVRKSGKMYYAFFTPPSSPVWKGEIELRGLNDGKYRVFDYVNSKDLGVVDAASPKLAVGFRDHLLIELTRL